MIKDKHHLLYSRKEWSKGWAYRLRSHPYLKAEIPMQTLHREIHCKIQSIPVPKEVWCQTAYEIIERYYLLKQIKDSDTIERKISFLICVFNCYAPETVRALKAQEKIIHDFYS